MHQQPHIEIIKFYAPYCGPCRAYGRTFAKFVNDTHIPYKEINIDEDPDTASAFGITQIPTTIVLVDGKVKHKKTGTPLYRDLQQMVGV